MKPKALILRTAGTNCDYETQYAFETAGAEAERVHVNAFISGQRSLDEFQILVLPGGFSYGDDIAAGSLLANEIKHKLRDALLAFVEAGKLVIGICNGFQVLVKTGLLPGGSSLQQQTTLYLNDSAKFECRWVYLQPEETPCVFTQGLSQVIYLPVAHAEGKFTAPKPVLDDIEEQKQVVFRYVNKDGTKADYPANPNGSDNAIAGICDPTGRVFGMMPHPERHLLRTHHPRWTREKLPEEGDGLRVFQNAVSHVRENF